MPTYDPSQCLTVQRVRSFLSEMKTLSAKDFQSLSIILSKQLSTGTLSGRDTYKIPSGFDFVGFQIQGFIRMPSLNSEPTAILTYLNLTPLERWMIKGANCLVGLKNADRKLPIFDGTENIQLSAIMPQVGVPIVYPPEAPLIIKSENTVQADFALQDSTAAIVGNASNYGVIIHGVLVAK